MAAGAAVELAATAIDVIDEIVDGDRQGGPAEIGRAQNASLALSFLAQRAVTGLSEWLEPQRVQFIANLLAWGSIACCDGQDMDLQLETSLDVSEETAHEMTERKSGSLVAMACQVGAAVATDDSKALAAVNDFGRHIGIVAQLLNDLNDVGLDPARRKGDLRRGKKTLPIAYSLRCAREEHLPQVQTWFANVAARTAQREQELVVTLHDLGAQQYTWAVAETHRREALIAAQQLGQIFGDPAVSRLRRLIPEVGGRRARGSQAAPVD